MKFDWTVIGVTAVGAFVLVSWTAWATHGTEVAAVFSKSSIGAGEWGDSFGALNTLFAAFGFVGVAITLLAQRRAFSVQQRELDRAHMDQHRQQFERIFFELLALMRELRKAVKYRPPPSGYHANPGEATDHTAFANATERLIGSIKNKEFSEQLDLAGLASTYDEEVHQVSEAGLGAYFRVVYTILDRTRRDEVLAEFEKVKYGNLLRSQLSSHEVTLAGFNGLTSVSKDFSDLLSYFRILKYIPDGPARTALQRHYPAHAFQARD